MSDAPPLPVLDDLSFHEQQLIEAARRGESLDGSDLDVEELAANDEPDHLVRADLLRELLLGRRGPLDPRGIRLRGAKIVGRLDLDHSVAVAGLGLERCVLVEPISMLYMQLPWLHLSRCNIHNLHADGMRTDANLQLHEVRSEQPTHAEPSAWLVPTSAANCL